MTLEVTTKQMLRAVSPATYSITASAAVLSKLSALAELRLITFNMKNLVKKPHSSPEAARHFFSEKIF